MCVGKILGCLNLYTFAFVRLNFDGFLGLGGLADGLGQGGHDFK